MPRTELGGDQTLLPEVRSFIQRLVELGISADEMRHLDSCGMFDPRLEAAFPLSHPTRGVLLLNVTREDATAPASILRLHHLGFTNDELRIIASYSRGRGLQLIADNFSKLDWQRTRYGEPEEQYTSHFLSVIASAGADALEVLVEHHEILAAQGHYFGAVAGLVEVIHPMHRTPGNGAAAIRTHVQRLQAGQTEFSNRELPARSITTGRDGYPRNELAEGL